jgi:hypothetical protein
MQAAFRRGARAAAPCVAQLLVQIAEVDRPTPVRVEGVDHQRKVGGREADAQAAHRRGKVCTLQLRYNMPATQVQHARDRTPQRKALHERQPTATAGRRRLLMAKQCEATPCRVALIQKD